MEADRNERAREAGYLTAMYVMHPPKVKAVNGTSESLRQSPLLPTVVVVVVVVPLSLPASSADRSRRARKRGVGTQPFDRYPPPPS